jgi:methyl-accepting chemotaxis protein
MLRVKKKVRAKLLGSFAFLAVLILCTGAVGLWAQAGIRSKGNDLYTKVAIPVGHAGNARANMLMGQLAILDAFVSGDKDETELYINMALKDFTVVDDEINEFLKSKVGTPQGREALQKAWQSYQRHIESDFLPPARSHDQVDMVLARTRIITQVFTEVNGALSDMTAQLSADAVKLQADAESTASTARTISLVLIGVAILLAGIMAFRLSRRTAGRLSAMAVAARSMAEGDLTVKLDESGTDEFAQTAQALGTALGNFRQTLSGIAESSITLAASSEELSAVTSQMASGAEEAATRATSVSEAAGLVARNVTTVASGAEEMTAAIAEIANNTLQAAEVASQAVALAETTIQSVSRLGQSSAEIGGVVAAITAIAEQTNLLALNATIESARAGEAGKGFAVVAAEVKELANETAKATGDISEKIRAIQADTSAAVESISQIGHIIEQINEIQTSIAVSMEQQAVTTAEMTRNVQEAATGTSAINHSMSSIATAVHEASAGALTTRHAVVELAHMATELEQLVSRFTIDDGAIHTPSAEYAETTA